MSLQKIYDRLAGFLPTDDSGCGMYFYKSEM